MKTFVAGSIVGFLCASLLLPSAKADLFPTCTDVELFQTALERVRANYIHEVKDVDLNEAAISGMTQSLDPSSEYMSAKDFVAIQHQADKTWGAVGLEISSDFDLPKVIAPLDGSPAASAGIRPGDHIIDIDGNSMKNIPLENIIGKLRGPINSKVTLTVLREGEARPLSISMLRAQVKVTSVKYEAKGDIGYIRIASFNGSTNKLLQDAVDSLKTKIGPNIKGYVLDLRSDPGGLLEQAVAVSDDFLDSGEIVALRGRTNADNETYTAKPGDIADGKPIIVLIDGGSAGASEIVAAALRDNHRATIVGLKSYGKGTIQTIIPLNDHGGGALRLTTAQYFRPSGATIDAVGVEPDIFVSQMPKEDATLAPAMSLSTYVPLTIVPASAIYPDKDKKYDDFQLSIALDKLEKG